MKRLPTLFLLVVSSILLNSCSANTLLYSWHEGSLEQYRLQKVLVVGVAQDETKRRIYEDTFVSSLTEKGIQATPSYTASNKVIEPGRSALQEVIDKTGTRLVMITHLVGRNEGETFYHSQNISPQHDHFSHDLYTYYPATYHAIYTSDRSSGITQVILETNLYDVRTGMLIWSARSRSIDPVMTRKYYQDLIELFLDDLKAKSFF